MVLRALTLLYAGIDVVASLERRCGEGTRASFAPWADTYVLPARPLGCTGVELYAARCGVLHTFTSDSDLSRSARARRIYYAWGTAKISDLQAVLDRSGTGDAVAVHVEDLHQGFRAGVLSCLREVVADETRMRHVESVAGAWFGDLAMSVVSAYLALPTDDSV
jgi:hypothetical protein